MVPECPTAARISESVAHMEELMGPINPISYSASELHLSLVGKIPSKT